MNYQHKSLAAGRWAAMSFEEQMANIGSEVSRAARWKRKGNADREAAALDRALELLDLSIESVLVNHRKDDASRLSKLKELTRCREVICDYFVGDNEYNTDPDRLIKYFDQFAIAFRQTKGES